MVVSRCDPATRPVSVVDRKHAKASADATVALTEMLSKVRVKGSPQISVRRTFGVHHCVRLPVPAPSSGVRYRKTSSGTF